MFDSAVACMLALSLSGPPIIPINEDGFANLSSAQIAPLERAYRNPGHLDWRVLTKTVGGRERAVVLLGEVHLATDGDLSRGKSVIDEFEDIATENGSTNRDPEWTYVTLPVAAVLSTPYILYYLAAHDVGRTSPMDLAKKGARVRTLHSVESLHQPTVIEELSLLAMTGITLVPFAFAGSLGLLAGRVVFGWRVRKPLKRFGRSTAYLIVFGAGAVAFGAWSEDPLIGARDVSMAKYVDRWVSDPANEDPLLVIVGKAHNPGVTKILSEKYGFVARPIERLPVTRGLPAPRPL